MVAGQLVGAGGSRGDGLALERASEGRSGRPRGAQRGLGAGIGLGIGLGLGAGAGRTAEVAASEPWSVTQDQEGVYQEGEKG